MPRGRRHSLVLIVLFFNASGTLPSASTRALAQTRPPVEVLAMDDGSTDRSGKIARTYGERVQYHFHENAGRRDAQPGDPAVRGRFRRVSGTRIHLWMPDRVERQLRAFAREPELDLVFGHMVQFHSEDLSPEDARRLVCDRTPQASPHLVPAGATERIERAGLLHHGPDRFRSTAPVCVRRRG